MSKTEILKFFEPAEPMRKQLAAFYEKEGFLPLKNPSRIEGNPYVRAMPADLKARYLAGRLKTSTN